MPRRERDGHPRERQGEQRPQHRAGAELVERQRRLFAASRWLCATQRPQARQQHDRRGNGGGEDELEGERLADARGHWRDCSSVRRRLAPGWVRDPHRRLQGDCPCASKRDHDPKSADRDLMQREKVQRVLVCRQRNAGTRYTFQNLRRERGARKETCICVPMRAAAAVLLVCAAARAEEIRIEVARGLRVARVEAAGRTHLLSARESGLLIDGKPAASAGFTAPMRLDGRALPGRLELFAERGTLVAVNAVDSSSSTSRRWWRASAPPLAARSAAGPGGGRAHVRRGAEGGAGAGLPRAPGASVLDQVYRNAANPPRPALEAAQSTAGEVLTWGRRRSRRTSARAAAGSARARKRRSTSRRGLRPYIRSGAEDGDTREWTVRLPLAEITAALRKAQRMQARSGRSRLESRTASGRAQTLALQTSAGPRRLQAVELRHDRVRAAAVTSLRGEDRRVRGGLPRPGQRSRRGALPVGRALPRHRRRRLPGDLAHYYPGAEIRRMY